MISVIIPVHNVENYLDRCVKSVLNSTYKDIEILLIENGSKDASLEKCREFEVEDSRIRVYTTEKASVSYARNLGLKYAHGEYIAFVDADDYISPYLYEEMIRCMENEKCDVVYCNYLLGSEMRYSFEIPRSVSADIISTVDFYYKLYIKDHTKHNVVWNKLITKESVKGVLFDEKLRFAEDRCFVAEIISKVKKICYIDEPMYYYYRGNVSSTCNSDIEGFMHLVHSLKKDIVFFENVEMDNSGLIKEYAETCLLLTIDNCKRIARKYGFMSQVKEFDEVLPEAVERVKKARYISKKIKYRVLLEHYYPKTLEYEAKVKRLLGRK